MEGQLNWPLELRLSHLLQRSSPMPYPCSPRRDLSNAPNSSSNGGRTRKLRRFPSRLRPSRGTPLGSTLERGTPLIYLSKDLRPRDRLWSRYFGPDQ